MYPIEVLGWMFLYLITGIIMLPFAEVAFLLEENAKGKPRSEDEDGDFGLWAFITLAWPILIPILIISAWTWGYKSLKSK